MLDLTLDFTLSNQAAPVPSDALIANAQTLLDQVKSDLNLTQGEVTMFIPDMPNVPPQDAPVMIAQANQAQTVGATGIRAVGVCAPVSSDIAAAGDNGVIPIGSARDYFQLFEARTLTGPATTTIVQQPAHGVLRLITEADRGTLFDSSAGPLKSDAGLYAYLPDSNYVGRDSGTIQVDFGNGLKVNVKYYFQSISGGLADDWIGTYCSKTGPLWKISTNLAPNGNNTLTSVEYQTPATVAAGTPVTNAATLTSILGTTRVRRNNQRALRRMLVSISLSLLLKRKSHTPPGFVQKQPAQKCAGCMKAKSYA